MRRGFSLLVLVIVVLLVNAPAFAKGTTYSFSIPLNLTVFVPCANGGSGETAQLTGNVHIVVSTTIAGDNLHMMTHYNGQGVSGVGLTTGDKYQATGVNRTDTNVHGVIFPYNTTTINNFRVVGQGSGNNLLVHSTVHITVNANGEVTANVDNLSVECK